MSRILIAGCGYVGASLATRLVAAGHEVHGLKRTPGGLTQGVIPLVADLRRPESLGGIPTPLDAVIYAAAASQGSEEAYRAIYVEGVRNLLQILQARQPALPRFIFTSSTGVHPESNGEWVDETSPVKPDRATARILWEGEQLVKAAETCGVVVRFSGIYGPGRTRLLRLVKNGEARCPRTPRYTNRIHRDDCAGVLEHLATLQRPPALVIATDHEPADLGEVYRWAANALGMPPPPIEEGAPGSPFPGSGPRGHKRCRNRRLLETGYRFRFPTFREGYLDLIPEILDRPSRANEA